MKTIKHLFLAVLLQRVSGAVGNQAENVTCGDSAGPIGPPCVCNSSDASNVVDDNRQISISVIFDADSYDWVDQVIAYTFQRIRGPPYNTTDEGDDDDGTQFSYTVANSGCDEVTAVRAYWDTRVKNGNTPPHAVMGARCSGASIAVARLASLENVPQCSPISRSARLSNKDEFPLFSRMMTPDGPNGEVAALVAMLRQFSWESVAILATDTSYSTGWVNNFRSLWVGPHDDETGTWLGQVGYADTIRLTSGGFIDTLSVRQTLDSLPASNARVVLLVAHSQHAGPFFQQVVESGFQPDTVWVGSSSWVGRFPNEDAASWLPSVPGFLGVSPFFQHRGNRDQNSQYRDYLKGLRSWQAEHGMEIWQDLPVLVAEVADSIVALVQAIRATPPSQRRNGTMVTENLRSAEFEGVTGTVKFTPEGDRANPTFSIINLQEKDGNWVWEAIGETEIAVGSASLYTSDRSICFAAQGCEPLEAFDVVDDAPEDTFPEEEADHKLPGWIFVLIAIPAALFCLLAIKYWRSKRAKRRLRAELESFKDSVVGVRTAEKNYIPTVVVKEGKEGDTLTDERTSIALVPVVPAPKIQWCWKETDGQMHLHDPNDIVGDPKDCWIKYDDHANENLEASYQEQGRLGEYSPLTGYVVNFETMIQTKPKTGFQRPVQRIVETSKGGVVDLKDVDLSNTDRGEPLPPDLAGEPQMVLVKGDVVQISKQRDEDGWAFGTKLHRAGEDVARQLLALATRGYDNADDANVFTDSGWFRLDVTRIPSADDLAELKNSVGDTGSLGAPKGWDPVQDPSVVQLHPLRQGDAEFDDVHKAFLSTLRGIKVHGISRVQNLAMWQSYVVKRQTICYRETGIRAGDATTVQDEKAQRQALQRFERCWLWHGTNCDVMDKIMQQGFNRSYCGKNATLYGKGVYFARDARYSSSRTYAVPDSSGYQYILACRVVVGEYCEGRENALTPDIRDAQTHSLYDSTVDNRSCPSIYVTYHDAQAYPEYLIKFKRS